MKHVAESAYDRRSDHTSRTRRDKQPGEKRDDAHRPTSSKWYARR